MEQQENKNTEKYTIDLVHIIRTLWHRAWIIALAAIILGSAFFAYAAFGITPTYSSFVLLYVNNSDISLGGTSLSISAADLSASRDLVTTYTVILKNRTTLERIIEESGVNRSVNSLMGMISARSEQETEIMRVTVTSTDPYEAAEIANCIAEVLPSRTAEIIDGSSMVVVDYAVPNLNKVAPNITRYTAIGLVMGALVAAAILAVMAILDDTVQNEEYILRTYNYPILAKIPNLTGESSGHYSYYRSGYYKKHAPYGYGKRAPYESQTEKGDA